MRHISYISIVATICIAGPLAYIVVDDILVILSPNYVIDKTIKWWDPTTLPYFFGICSFMFEGNALALEIYQQSQNPEQKYTKEMGWAIGFVTLMLVSTGSLSYAAYG